MFVIVFSVEKTTVSGKLCSKTIPNLLLYLTAAVSAAVVNPFILCGKFSKPVKDELSKVFYVAVYIECLLFFAF